MPEDIVLNGGEFPRIGVESGIEIAAHIVTGSEPGLEQQIHAGIGIDAAHDGVRRDGFEDDIVKEIGHIRDGVPDIAGSVLEMAFDVGESEHRQDQRDTGAVEPFPDPFVAPFPESHGILGVIAFKMAVQFGQEILEEIVLAESEDDVIAVWIAQDLFKLQRHAGNAGVDDEIQTLLQSVLRLLLQRETVLPDQFQGAEQPDGVLLEPESGFSDTAHHACTDVLHAVTGVVQQLIMDRIVEEGIDRKIPAVRIIFRRTELVVPEDHVFGSNAGTQRVFGGSGFIGALAEGTDLDGIVPEIVKVYQPEAFSDDDAAEVAEDLFDLFRCGGGGDIVIFRFAPEEEIPHGTADDVCLEPGILQACDDPGDMGSDLVV